MRAVSQNPSRDRDIRYEVTDGPAFFAEDQSGDLFLGKNEEKKVEIIQTKFNGSKIRFQATTKNELK